MVQEARRVTQEAMDWLRESYGRFAFYAERDAVWTLQTRLAALVEASGLGLRVFDDYLMLPGRPRPLYADLVLLGPNDNVELALEVQYEPAHWRTDILGSKLPFVFWGADVVNDIQRVREFERRQAAASAWSLFIDEGGHFRHRPPPPGSSWHDWRDGRWALISRFPKTAETG